MRKILVVAAMGAAVLLSTAPAHAATWTQIPSGTSSEITAIEYQSATRFWFTTANGEIFTRQPDGSFVRKFGPSAVRLNDIEFQDGGNIGFAVGNAGQVLRSQDAGATWQNVNTGPAIAVSSNAANSTFPNCTRTDPLGDVNSVRFAGANRVWIFAEGSQMAKSEPATASDVGKAGTWVDANDIPNAGGPYTSDDTCKISSSYNEGLSDAFFAPSAPDVAYIVAGSFSEVFFTTNDLASAAAKRPESAGNAGGGHRNITGDPSNPNRMWSVSPDPYGVSTAHYTEDGYTTSNPFNIVNYSARDFPQNGPYDVDFNGGTVLSAGDAGMILTSINGRDFYYVDAPGSLATEAWRAVGLASASDGAVGGGGGVLAVTTQANTIPDIVAPAGTITGPATATAGTPTAYTANVADNAGGSGIDTSSFAWTGTGLPAATGNPVSLTFPSPGFYTITVTFKDLAGNIGTASKSVQVGAASTGTTIPPGTPNPTPSKTVTVAGGSVKLSGPKACVAPGQTFTATLAFKKKRTNARKRVIKVTKVYFFIDGTRVKIDKKTPFKQTLSVRSYAPGSKHTLKARAFLKVRTGKAPTKSISTSFQVCSS